MPTTAPSSFVVSLDFELFWGVRDKRSLATYGDNLHGVWDAIPALLERFASRQIHATWAAVGFLLCESFDEVRARAPAVRPRYRRAELCPYRYVDAQRGRGDERAHFALPLARQIAATPHQELGTHTLSHYYCLEEPSDPSAFTADLAAAVALHQEKLGRAPRSLVFPRNQHDAAHTRAAASAGIAAVRGSPRSRLYDPRADEDEALWRRGLRLVDAYLPVTRGLSRSAAGRAPTDVPATRFLRPYDPRLRRLDPLRVRRITGQLRAAAERGTDYHLWWHPHNFGVHLTENLRLLDQILDGFDELRASGRMASRNMGELAA